MEDLRITVNGIVHEVTDAGPHTTLLSWLRSHGLTGAKEGCAEGECGACAVLLVRESPTGEARLDSINSCLVTLGALHGSEVITVEGLAGANTEHPVQQTFAHAGASQCGFCTPGFMASLAGEYYRAGRLPGQHGQANGVDLHALGGNLCRCTGYRAIRDAAGQIGFPAPDDPVRERLRQPVTPPAPVHLADHDGAFIRPANLEEALYLLTRYPQATLRAGGTDLGVDQNLRHRRPGLVIAVDALPELRGIHIDDDHIEIGAGLTLSEIEEVLGGAVPLLDEMFPRFASPLIRHAATLGGNLGTASPVGDSAPCLLALDARVVLSSQKERREVPVGDYFLGYRQTVRRPDEIITSVRIPRPLAPQVAFHKITKRPVDDISSVSVAFAFRLDRGSVAAARIGLGGVAATPIRARTTEELLVGQPWTEETVDIAAAALAKEGTPLTDARASAAYRSAMLEQSLRRFHAELTSQEMAS
ncbi:xanthine dehydrogenase small subunit [Austwickia chelonae]|uniref:Xanthine dehydrogenase small subunit n=1 Tax=Austwickia chelonae NBRC 105200 TaxID=1184607 RepID=K6VMM6_9MICO|nr:FAD binding domain-containing protein [Austwickia chelonae]GAB76615.1 xanthine dehydrogenase small subunit [Austwickia chelonae NBRC 105200]SEW28061.1 xanthine dehydrogenase small subunit [Austwickia chelonae]